MGAINKYSTTQCRRFWQGGEPWVWGSAACMGGLLLMTFVLLSVIFVNGVKAFWPKSIHAFELTNGERWQGSIEKEAINHSGFREIQIKTSNRDVYGIDFKWILTTEIASTQKPENTFVFERTEYGNFVGQLSKVITPEGEHEGSLEQLKNAFNRVSLIKEKMGVQDKAISKINNQIEALRSRELKLKYKNRLTEVQIASFAEETAQLTGKFEKILTEQNALSEQLKQFMLVGVLADQKSINIPLSHIVYFYQPNNLTFPGKIKFFMHKIRELLFENPRESNTEGGLFPAICGTVILIFLMTFLSFPLGVVAGIYLREYAREGWMVRCVRIAVNNLAGVPSIVYGIFGLVFFVYGIGHQIDVLFFPEHLPTPTFGTGGILWASMTLGILTVPVVIVSTEEALGNIPGGMREASYSLGATKFQTLVKVLIPMASPGILTGFILAMARAAGEVAPLMITGVVKLAPTLPIDGNAPFFHLDRKFMHLGFHIYDVGFQSPNVEAAKPFVYVTTLLLVFIVLLMTSTAIVFRNKMKKKYQIKGF